MFEFLAGRNRELLGLAGAGVLLALGAWTVGAAQNRAFSALPVGIWLPVGAALIGHLALRVRARSADQLLLPICLVLCALGLTALRSLDSPYLANQQMWIATGVAAMVLVVWLVRDPRGLGSFKYSAGVAGILLLLSPIFFGTARGGSKLWLVFGGFSFQPAELAKILLTIFLAAYLAEKKEVLAAGGRRRLGLTWPETRHFAPLLVTWLISLAILVLERDLGSSLIFFSLFILLLYTATGRFAYVAVGLLLFFSGAALAARIFSHVAARIDVWLQPLPSDVGGSAYQVAQSLFALQAGGLWGTGWGSGFLGRQVAMPAVHNDFIFSVLGEELGLAGTAAIILLFMLLTARGFHIAVSRQDDFSRLLAAGLATVTGIQSIVIIGGVTKLIPLTGVTLPFISYGGSSVLTGFIILGLLLVLSKEDYD